ncbi:MAG: hypothetical protein HY866_03425, partial [Chloroflexi bacterium]|nr:hypothetical protein [Chloroflexota bacterium]
GSQPQYYYLLTQLPVYEFLPLLGSLCAGFFGLTQLWRWRRERAEVVRDALYAAEQAEQSEQVALESGAELPSPESGSMAQTMIASAQRTAIMFAPPESEADGELIGLAADDEDAPPDDTLNEEYAAQEYAVPSRPVWDFPAALARPFDWIEEQSRRASDPEWIGAFPFLAMVGWWAIAMTLGLTIAGEKMPWLTTHLSVPMILISGWWLGRIASGIRRETLRDNGWLVLLVVLPLALMSFGQVVLGFWEGKPFQGADVRDLMASGNWFGALLIFLGALYVIGHFGRRIGVEQIGRMTVLSGAAVLGVLTLRAAIMACFINYDYATEYLVYAHSGPAVKTALAEIDRIAEITNEGANMRIVFDDESSWPYTWYLRDYPNYGYLRGEAGSVDASSMDGARVVIVGSKKVGDVRRILGDRYYEFAYFRLWWPMQEYFNLNYERVSNVFSTEEGNIAARYYRQALWDIWLDRDYQTYAQAMCIEAKQYRCEEEANWGTNDDERDQFRESCERAVVLECAKDDRFTASKWPVSDRMYFFVDKQIAAQVWDAGIGSSTVDIREPEYPEDRVFQFIDAEAILGANLGMVGPRGIALDADGLIYVADTERHQILVMDGQGALVRTIGQPLGAPEAGGLKQPWDIDIAPDGTIYIADTWNNRVAVFAADGTYLRAWGHEGIPGSDPSTDAMWGPRAIMVGPDGNIYVADTGGKRVRKYSPEGEWLDDLGRGGSAIGEVDEPVGLAFNPISQEVYVAEAWNKRIQAFDGAGDPLRTFDVSMWFRNRQSYNRPYIAVSPDGTLIYVVDMDDKHRIVAYNLNGEPVLSFNQPDKLEENLLGVRSPAGIAVDAAGRLYVVDSEQAKVYVFPPSQIAGQIAPVAPGAIPDNAFPESFSPDSSGSDASSESEAGSPAQDDPNAAGQDSSPAEEGDSAPAGEVIATPAG